MLNFRIIFRIIGFLLLGEAFTLLLPLLFSLIYGEADCLAFLYSAALCTVAGVVLWFFSRKARRVIGKREGFLIVTLVWVIFSLFGSLPFLLSGAVPHYTDAFFETMSGFTTTGSTVIPDVEILPHGILFWRSLIQWLGGMGIIVLGLAILPAFGIGGMQLFAAEVPGPTTEKLSPRIAETARRLWLIYFLFTGAETLLLWVGGMSFFDAVNHSLTTLATGGFSTKNASIAYWDSPFIHYVIIFFMILAGTNFSLSYCMVTGKYKKAFSNEEFRYYLLFISLFTVIIFLGLLLSSQPDVEKSFRDALFQVVSIMTTTGYVTTNYLTWIPILVILLFSLFFFGGSAGSTGGGMKIMRVVLLMKDSYYELRRMVHPNAIIPVRFNKRAVPDYIITNVLAFFMFYFIVFVFSTIIFTVFEPDLDSAMGAVATCLGNIGPGLGNFGPVNHFGHLHEISKWFLAFLMLLGRLELFTVLVLFSPGFWKK